MSYVVIGSDGVAQIRSGDPTYEAIGEIVGGAVSSPIRTKVGVVGWIHDNAFALCETGELARNSVGAALLAVLGAPTGPLAGPVVLTRIERDMIEGDTPVSLNGDGAEGGGSEVHAAVRTVRAIAAVHRGDPPDDMPVMAAVGMAMALHDLDTAPFPTMTYHPVDDVFGDGEPWNPGA